MSSGVGCRRCSDPALLWLWCRPAATAPIRPLAWKHPYATGAALKRNKEKKNLTSRVPAVAQQVKNLTSIHEDVGLIPGLAHWVKDLTLW